MKLNTHLVKFILILGLIIISASYKIKSKSEKKPEETIEKYSIKNNERLDSLKKIVWEGHFDAISEVCRGGKTGAAKYILGIRETGEDSILRIAQGAKTKPHTILEKSIKKSSMEKYYGKDWINKTKDFYEHFKGLVGHYDKSSLLGLRTDGWGNPDCIQCPSNNDKECTYLPKEKALEFLNKNKNKVENFYTGDYDLHEVYTSNLRLIPEATKEKVNVLNTLNKYISQLKNGGGIHKREGVFEIVGGRIHMSKTVNHAYAMFQHGDQATYKMNQHLEAGKGNKAQVVDAVNKESSEPLAWNVRGEWYVTNNLVEHRDFRRILKLVAPSHWIDGMKNEGLTHKINKK